MCILINYFHCLALSVFGKKCHNTNDSLLKTDFNSEIVIREAWTFVSLHSVLEWKDFYFDFANKHMHVDKSSKSQSYSVHIMRGLYV